MSSRFLSTLGFYTSIKVVSEFSTSYLTPIRHYTKSTFTQKMKVNCLVSVLLFTCQAAAWCQGWQLCTVNLSHILYQNIS